MPTKGRQRLTPEEIEARSREYCRRYGVTAPAAGLPPFPSGRRETQQHRDWIAVYKAYNRLHRRLRGQCERCAAPASDGSVFCDEHRAGVSARAARHDASLEDRRALLANQNGRCPICSLQVELWDSVDHDHSTHLKRGVLHSRCNRLVGLAEAVGPEALSRLRSYLWPARPSAPKPPNRARKPRN